MHDDNHSLVYTSYVGLAGPSVSLVALLCRMCKGALYAQSSTAPKLGFDRNATLFTD